MSLDVALTGQGVIEEVIEYDGETWSLWRKRAEPGEIIEHDEAIYTMNITRYLGSMADEAGIYEALWRPYRLSPDFIKTDDYDYKYEQGENIRVVASDISGIIRSGLEKMKADPSHYKVFDSPNGCGLYEHFVPLIEKYLEALEKHPHAVVTCDGFTVIAEQNMF